MRMWMTDVKKMCRKHLLGEHTECHMLLGTLKKKKSIQGFIDNDLLEPKSLQYRHDKILNEMLRRGYNHRTPLRVIKSNLSYLTKEQIKHRINKDKSLKNLVKRCVECRNNFEEQ